MTTTVTKKGSGFQVSFTGTQIEAEKLVALFDSCPLDRAMGKILPTLDGGVLADKARARGLCPAYRGDWYGALKEAFRYIY